MAEKFGNRISIHPNSQAVLLYNSPRDCWENKTESITAIYEEQLNLFQFQKKKTIPLQSKIIP